MLSTLIVEEYRRARRPYAVTYLDTGQSFVRQTSARLALDQARAEQALREQERAGRIRFEWEWDDDYETEGSYGYDTEEETRAAEQYELGKLQSGTWEVLGVTAWVNGMRRMHDCPSCECGERETEERAASLWGIVVDVDDRYGYRREVERDLAREAGVI